MKTKPQLGPPDHETRDHRTTETENCDGRILVTRRGLAVALGVSLRTVERMLHDEEIEAVRLRGWSVRFYVPDVVRELVASGTARKNGRKARTSNQSSVVSSQWREGTQES